MKASGHLQENKKELKKLGVAIMLDYEAGEAALRVFPFNYRNHLMIISIFFKRWSFFSSEVVSQRNSMPCSCSCSD